MYNIQKEIHMNGYRFLLHRETWKKMEDYLALLRSGHKPGCHLQKKLIGLDLSTITKNSFLEALIRTKKPQIFAESQLHGDGSDWNQTELSILGDISLAMPVTVFDNGHYHSPKIYETPFKAHLVFTSGALLRNSYGIPPADYKEITKGGEIDPDAYYNLYLRRLLPAFQFANDTALQKSKKAFITIPCLGCGQFAGRFRNQLPTLLQNAIENLLVKHAAHLKSLAVVHFEIRDDRDKVQKQYHETRLIVNPIHRGKDYTPQLNLPDVYEGEEDDFSSCELTNIVAWDPVAWPGNDFYTGARCTDDGVKAAATDAMFIITGIQGKYDHQRYQYRPQTPYATWEDVVYDKNIQLHVEDTYTLYPT